MGYRIEYGKQAVKTPIHSRGTGLLPVILIILSVIICTYCIKLYGMDWLIPGDQEVTKEALSQMITNVSQGEAVREAFTAFCREIIIHAESLA